jgi:regulator of sigma E protease
MNDFLLGVASFLLVLIPLVVIHEFGHFIAAKLSGITVLEFGIGFPPRALTLFRRGDTIYTLNWLPIGGFVRPYGEDFVKPKTEEEMSGDRQEIEERGIKNPKRAAPGFTETEVLQLAAGPGINFVAALVLFVVIGLVGQPFARADVTVYDITGDSVAGEAGLLQGDIIREINGEEVQSADEFNSLVRDHKDEAITLIVERNGEQLEPITVPAADIDAANVERAYITGLYEDMPAFEAGIQVEDMIIAVDGIEITSVKQLQDYTKAHEDQEMMVTVVRGDETLTLPVTPRKDKDGNVLMGIQIAGVEPAAIGLIAVNQDAKTYTRRLSLGEAIKTGVDEFVTAHRLLVEFVDDLFAGRVDPSAARPVSPVGIGQLGGPVLEQSLDEREAYPIVWFAAMISIALAITNLLPVPGLDGGRILFVVIEIIRGKPMEPEREGLIHFIGLLLLLGLVAFTVVNDIVNPINIQNLTK